MYDKRNVIMVHHLGLLGSAVNEPYIFMFNINLIENYDYNILGNYMNNSGESGTCILF